MALTSQNGTVSAAYDHDAFGNVLTGSEEGFHLTTKRKYTDIGVYYFFQRWYDPEVGKFIQRDLMETTNLYLYCSNNPLNSIDPEGLAEENLGTCFARCVSRCRSIPNPYKIACYMGCAAYCGYKYPPNLPTPTPLPTPVPTPPAPWIPPEVYVLGEPIFCYVKWPDLSRRKLRVERIPELNEKFDCYCWATSVAGRDTGAYQRELQCILCNKWRGKIQ